MKAETADYYNAEMLYLIDKDNLSLRERLRLRYLSWWLRIYNCLKKGEDT